jgi:hypothetical protein
MKMKRSLFVDEESSLHETGENSAGNHHEVPEEMDVEHSLQPEQVKNLLLTNLNYS